MTMNKWSRRAFITTGVLAGGAVVFGVAIRRGNPVDEVARSMTGEGETLLNVWLKIAADNSVTVIVPHAEMGQGVHTTLAMMLADELDADWKQIKVLEAPSSKAYANYALVQGFAAGETEFPAFLTDSVNGFFLMTSRKMGMQITGGSASVRFTGKLAMRVAGASARAVLLQAASDAWQVNVDELQAQKGFILHTASGRKASFASFAERATSLSQTPNPVLKSSNQFTIMGTSVNRLDIPAKVDGSARFGIDAVLAGMKYAAIRAAPVFGATVTKIEPGKAMAMAGVREVVNLEQAVAVIADGYWQASQALKQIEIKWSTNAADSLGQSDIFDQFSEALDTADAQDDYTTDIKRGHIDRAFGSADRVIKAEYRVPYLAHATMEPMNCTAWVHDGQCELWVGTQNPLGFSMEVATQIGFEPDRVIVHNQYLGGGFGRRIFSDFARQAARLALKVSYPVKLIWSREEDIQHDHYRQACISRFAAALDVRGQPTAWHNQYLEKHDPEEAPQIPYAIPNQLIHYTDSKTHVPWGYWRSVDHSLHAFFTESFIDELAVAAHKDPMQYRRELLLDKPRYLNLLERTAHAAGWTRALPENHGRGIAIHESFGTLVAQVAEVTVRNTKVHVKRVVCVVDPGFAVHPDGLKAQMESGIIYGLTAALYGEITIQKGRVKQSNFHDYKMLRMRDTPRIKTFIIESGNRTGGGGEPGTPPIAAALSNAIFNATGKRIRELPIKNYKF